MGQYLVLKWHTFLVEEGPEYINGLKELLSCVDFRNMFWCSQ